MMIMMMMMITTWVDPVTALTAAVRNVGLVYQFPVERVSQWIAVIDVWYRAYARTDR